MATPPQVALRSQANWDIWSKLVKKLGFEATPDSFATFTHSRDGWTVYFLPPSAGRATTSDWCLTDAGGHRGGKGRGLAPLLKLLDAFDINSGIDPVIQPLPQVVTEPSGDGDVLNNFVKPGPAPSRPQALLRNFDVVIELADSTTRVVLVQATNFLGAVSTARSIAERVMSDDELADIVSVRLKKNA